MRKLFNIFVIFLTLISFATAQNGNEITAVDAPVASGSVNHVYFEDIISANSPYLSSQTPKLNGGDTSGTNTLAVDQEPNSTSACAINTTTGLANIDTVISGYKRTNLLWQGSEEGNTSIATPECVFGQAQADASYLAYTQNTVYLTGDYILQNGYYWKQINNCQTGSGVAAGCETGSSPATFPSSAGASNVSDGAATWQQIQTGHAPVQDVWCGNGHSCNGCDTTTAGAIYNINTLGACTLAQIYQGQPIPELPYWNWYKQVIAAIISHYNSSSLLSKIGWMRFGFPMGDENGGLGLSTWPYMGSSFAQMLAQYMSWTSRVDSWIMAQSPAMHMSHNMNCAAGIGYASGNCQFADQLAIMANNYGFWEIENSDLQMSDFYNLTGTGSNNCPFPPQSAATFGSGCTQGNWFYNCHTFSNMHCGLQLIHGSNPAYCENGSIVSGPLAPLPSGSTYCPNGFVGMLPWLLSLCNTGVGTPNTKVCVNIFEAPIVAGVYASGAGSGTSYPSAAACDVLLALVGSTLYPNTTGYISQYAAYETPYLQVFADYLGLGQIPPGPPTGLSVVVF